MIQALYSKTKIERKRTRVSIPTASSNLSWHSDILWLDSHAWHGGDNDRIVIIDKTGDPQIGLSRVKRLSQGMRESRQMQVEAAGSTKTLNIPCHLALF